MLPCKEIVRILSSDEPMPFMKKAELKMHLMMCKHCSNYSSQLKMMKRGFTHLFSEISKTTPEEVESIEKETIKKVCGDGT